MDLNSPLINLVIPCAGAGARSGMAKPKQYAIVANKPMVVHTLESLLQVNKIQNICLVVSPRDEFIEEILTKYALSNESRIRVLFEGGESRAHSVLAVLKFFSDKGFGEDGWILVHDAARCLITPELVELLIQKCSLDSVGGLLAIPLADTLKESIEGRVCLTASRDNKWLAQTPQMFKLGVLTNALKNALLTNPGSITDEASALEAIGLNPLLIEGASTNFKITYPHDFELAQALLNHRSQKILDSNQAFKRV